MLRQKSRGLHSHPFISSSYIVIANAPNIAIRQYSKANLGLVLNCLNVYSFSYNLRVEKIFGRTCVVIHFRLHLLFLHKILLNVRFDCANTFRESFREISARSVLPFNRNYLKTWNYTFSYPIIYAKLLYLWVWNFQTNFHGLYKGSLWNNSSS